MESLNYKNAGVDINKKANFVTDIYGPMKSTYGPRVIENPNGFAGLFSLNYKSDSATKEYKNPVLVTSTDGVGTKLKIAFMLNKHDTVGIDLVAMCVNDAITLGAEILFFLDYLASSRILPEKLKEVIKGITTGCHESGCALLGGETPELPGFYNDDEYDLAGFVVGVVEKDEIINGKDIKPDDVVIGLKSSGLHSNGYSLARKVIFEKAGLSINQHVEELKCTVGEEMLKPTKIYVKSIRSVLDNPITKNSIKGIANITGGGLVENIPRILPEGCHAYIKKDAWLPQSIFSVIKSFGNINEEEMYRVFNMGIGMVLITARENTEMVLDVLINAGEEALIIGNIESGERKVVIN